MKPLCLLNDHTSRMVEQQGNVRSLNGVQHPFRAIQEPQLAQEHVLPKLADPHIPAVHPQKASLVSSILAKLASVSCNV